MSSNNVSSGLKIYCGVRKPKKDQRLGSASECFQSGRRSGIKVGIDIQTEKNKKKLNEVEAVIRAETIKRNIKDIETKGLLPFKQMIHLDSLSKDLVRSIAVKLTGTNDQITGYSKMSREELINSLVDRGWHR